MDSRSIVESIVKRTVPVVELSLKLATGAGFVLGMTMFNSSVILIENDTVENNKFQNIASLLEQHPVCAKIVAFFLKHPFAMDTARGIAHWWIDEDPGDTEEALHRLVMCGVVIVRTYGGINLYSFTTNPSLRAKLKEYFRRKK